MKKSFFLAISVAALLTACNNAEKPAAETPPATPPTQTEVKVQVEKPKEEPAVQKVEVDKNGVKINVKDKNGNTIEINAKDPK